MRSDIIIEDTTLRDGEQAPGVAWSAIQKMRVLEALLDAGVTWVEVGIPQMGGEEREFVQQARRHANRATLVAWNRGVREDLELSLSLGYDAIHIGLPTSDIHLESSIGKTREWVADRAVDLIRFAKDKGAFVSISAEDVGRTDVGFLQEYAGRIAEAGADRLRLSDTIGILTPEGYGARVRAVAEAADIDLQCHCHNDFGLAVANTLAGLQAGARYFHVCVNGMGERAGMPDLAQMVMALKTLYDRDLGIRTENLVGLASLVAEETQSPAEPWRPITGRNVFAHESGIHSNGMLKNSKSFEPIAPEEVGGERRIVVGKHSGRAAIVHMLEQAGITADPTLMPETLTRVRARSIQTRGEVSPSDLVALYADLQEGQATRIN